nr:helix-turn-helix transcriptional regulator [Bradyrhizobium sp. 6(2017)]
MDLDRGVAGLSQPDAGRVVGVAEPTGISIQNLSILKTGKAKAMRFSTLSAICRELDCRPGDILEYVPGDEGDADGGEGNKPKRDHVTLSGSPGYALNSRNCSTESLAND